MPPARRRNSEQVAGPQDVAEADSPVQQDAVLADAPASDAAESACSVDFVELVEKYETPLLRYLRRVANPNDIEDLAQEAFLRLHRQFSQSAEIIHNVGAFLFRVAHNLAMDSLRRKRTRDRFRDQAIEEAVRPQDDSPEALTSLVRRAAAEKALEELARLPSQERRILLLKVIQDFSLRDIGEIMGMSHGNVAYHLNSGLKTLASRLKASGVI
jgi:RNA polymerase sigma-70 factor (ECF subfamily)